MTEYWKGVVPEAEARKEKLMQLTNFEPQTIKHDSMYGKGITYLEFLKFERNRINADPDRKAMVAQKGDEVALFVNRVA